MILKSAVFIVVSTILVFVSWRTFISWKTHGFFRFFAWELLLLIILINIDYWDKAVFSIPQIISWCFLSISLYLVLDSVYLMLTAGNPSNERSDSSLFRLEKTTELITFRIYRYIRHPMYSSLMFLVWGMFFKHMDWMTLSLTLLANVFLVIAARMEENENIAYFGKEYVAYASKTKRFIPFII